MGHRQVHSFKVHKLSVHGPDRRKPSADMSTTALDMEVFAGHTIYQSIDKEYKDLQTYIYKITLARDMS